MVSVDIVLLKVYRLSALYCATNINWDWEGWVGGGRENEFEKTNKLITINPVQARIIPCNLL